MTYTPEQLIEILQTTCEVNSIGIKFWYLNGKLHRLDGPAIEIADGTKQWYLNDKKHRIDGPAVEMANGQKEWWIDGKKYTEEEFNKEVQIK